MVDVSIQGLPALQEKFNTLADTLNSALLQKSQALADALTQKVRDNLSGPVLNERTGVLSDSIDNTVESSGNGASASIFVSGDVPYASIQEYGGTTKAHLIEAINGKALAFNWQGKQAFFTHINHPGSVIPQRSYLRSALEDMQDDIVDGITDTLGETLAS